MFTFSAQALPNSLTRLSAAVVPSAKSLYDLILAYCKQKPPYTADRSFVSLLHRVNDLADEAFALLLKLSVGNPLPLDANRRLWTLFDILSRLAVAPSPAFKPYVIAYVEELVASRRDVVGALARVIERRLKQEAISTADGIPLGKRWPPFSSVLLEMSLKSRAASVPAETTVLLPSGRSILHLTGSEVSKKPHAAGMTIVIEPWETTADVIAVVAAHLGMPAAADHLSLHIANAVPAELLPPRLVTMAAVGLEQPPTADPDVLARGMADYGLPAHHAAIVHARDRAAAGAIVVGRGLRSTELPCAALLAANTVNVPAVLLLRRAVWLPEPDTPAIAACAPFTQLSYHQVRASTSTAVSLLSSLHFIDMRDLILCFFLCCTRTCSSLPQSCLASRWWKAPTQRWILRCCPWLCASHCVPLLQKAKSSLLQMRWRLRQQCH